MNAVLIALFASLIPMIMTVPIASAWYSRDWLHDWKHAGAPDHYTAHSLRRMVLPAGLGLVHAFVYALVFNKLTPDGITVSSAGLAALAGLIAATLVPLAIMAAWMLTYGPAAKHSHRHRGETA